MQAYFVSLTGDLLNVFIEYRADTKRAVELYLEREYLRGSTWRLPWCAVYEEIPVSPLGSQAIVVKSKCGEIWEDDYAPHR